MHPVDQARRDRGDHVRRCSKDIDGPKINGAGMVAWRRQCKNRTTHESGRCRFHPTRFDDRRPWYPGMRTEDFNFVYTPRSDAS